MSCSNLINKLKTLNNTIQTFNLDKDVSFIISLAKNGNKSDFITDLVYGNMFGSSEIPSYKKFIVEEITSLVKEGKLNKPEDLLNFHEMFETPLVKNYKAYTYNLFKDKPFVDAINSDNSNLSKIIYNYTDTDYKLINSKHRDFWYNDNVDVEKIPGLSRLNELFKYKGNYLKPVYRGTSVYTKVLKSSKPGDIIISSSPISTTKSNVMAHAWADGEPDISNKTKVVFSIENNLIPQYDISKYSMWPKEEEVLIEPNLPFKLVKIDRSGDTPIIHLKMIPFSTKDLKKGLLNLLSFGGISITIGHNRQKDNNEL